MQLPLVKTYQLSVKEVIQRLETNVNNGLTAEEAVRRLLAFGKNELELHQQKRWWRILGEQFISPLVWILMFAAILAFSFAEWLEGSAIVAVILINAGIGFFMEMQALRSMEALRKLAQTKALVYRNGQLSTIQSSELVVGDVVFLNTGDVIPADCRVIEQHNLGVKEAALTGESNQVKKQTAAIAEVVTLADRKNLLFKGTIISRGNAKAIVVATGKNTELGHIAHLTKEAVTSATPLEKKLNFLSQKLIGVTVLLTIAIMLLGILQGRDWYLMVKTAIALAVAAIPEGLPIVATIALARGMLRLAKQKVIVKQLSAVETLGETQIIFTDKTGTLTQNQLSADTAVFDFEKLNLDTNNTLKTIRNEPLSNTFAFNQLMKTAVLCNNATVNANEEGEQEIGDPLEIALLNMANQQEHSFLAIRKKYPRLQEIPFDSDTKMMGTLHQNGDKSNYLVCIKGALEVILEESDYVLTADGKKELTEKDEWVKQANELAQQGLRVLGFAYSEIDEAEDDFFHNLNFIGFIGFLDPPRPEVKAAIQTCHEAGIRVIMVTGDHPETAKTIALKTGLTDAPQAVVINGGDLQNIQDSNSLVLQADIFARVNPAQKLELVNFYQKTGKIVAMTGDGINDSPALKQADIGIAMGKKGTEAAKEAADLILEDDSFISIVHAVKQGRGIFANIRYFVIYLLSCNLSELMSVGIAFFINLASPLFPLQILFLNMVTDIFPALALGLNKEADQVMQDPPRNPASPLLSKIGWWAIVVHATGMTIAVIGALLFGVFYLETSPNVSNNLAFYTLILAQLWQVFNLPKSSQSFFNNEITRNKYVWLALLICIAITVAMYFIPTTKAILHLETITFELLGIVFLFSLFPIVWSQFFKKMKWII